MEGEGSGPFWHVHTEEGDLGPLAPQDVRAWIREDPARLDAYVWREGLAAWIPAREISDLARALPPAALPPSALSPRHPPERIPPDRRISSDPGAEARRRIAATHPAQRETPPILKLLLVALAVFALFRAIRCGADWKEENFGREKALDRERRMRFPDDYPPE